MREHAIEETYQETTWHVDKGGPPRKCVAMIAQQQARKIPSEHRTGCASQSNKQYMV